MADSIDRTKRNYHVMSGWLNNPVCKPLSPGLMTAIPQILEDLWRDPESLYRVGLAPPKCVLASLPS